MAQLGGAHIACEWVSNVMTKLLQRGRLAAYLEQSTRYMPYDVPIGDGLGYRYWRHPELGPEYEAAMDFLFESYSEALPRVEAWAAERFPRGDDEPEAAHARSIRAKALDLLRGLLPAASLSHVGIFASGQAYEQLLLRLFASPLPEARDYATMILEELKAVVPSFVARVERPERGGEWISYLEERERPASAGPRGSASTGPPATRRPAPRCGCCRCRGARRSCSPRSCSRRPSVSEDETRAALRNLPPDERAAMLAELVGERDNRRHRPGRGFEALRYRFEVVSDYGAFRDLQRHRLLTVQWQTLGPELGAGVPHELDDAGVGDLYRAGLERSREEYARIAEPGRPELAHYALALGLPDPLRARHERARGDAPDRAALRPRGPPGLPRRGARAARRDRARAPRRGRHDDVRGPRHRAAARAHPLRDPRAREAGRAGLSCRTATRLAQNG